MARSNGTEGPGIDAGPSVGSEGDNGGGGPLPDNTPSSGLGEGDKQDSRRGSEEEHEDNDSNEEDKVDWEEGGSEEPEEPSEHVAPLPYRSAAELGFTTKATAQYIGFRCFADMELFLFCVADEHCGNQPEGGCRGFMYVHTGV